MAQDYNIGTTIKQIQSIIRVETKSIKKKGTAGEGKLVAIAKLCNSLHGLVELTSKSDSEKDPALYGKPNFRKEWAERLKAENE